MSAINKYFKNYIDVNGIKQVHLSRQTNISNKTLSDILLGKRKMLANEFLAICDATGINPNIFLDINSENIGNKEA